MAYQDFTTYTETDAAGRLTVAANGITIASLDNDEGSYVYKDFTASYFSADFDFSFRISVTLGTGVEAAHLFAVANAVNDVSAIVAGSGDALYATWSDGTLSISESNGGSVSSQSLAGLSLNTPYFVRISRDETVGTFGALYAYVYTDAQYTELVGKITLNLTKKTDFRYLYAFSGVSTGGGGVAFSGSLTYLDLTPNPHTLKRLREDFKDLAASPSDDVTADVGFFTASEINQWIVDGVVDIAVRGLCDQLVSAGTVTNAVRTVTFSGHKVCYVEYSALGLPQMSEVQLGHDQTGGTTPARWYMDGSARIGVEPFPAAGASLSLYVAGNGNGGVAFPSTNYDIPLIPPAFRHLILFYLLVRAFIKAEKNLIAIGFYNIYITELAENMELCIPTTVETFEDKRMPDATIVK